MKALFLALLVLGAVFAGGCGIPSAPKPNDGKCLDYLEGRSKDPRYCLDD